MSIFARLVPFRPLMGIALGFLFLISISPAARAAAQWVDMGPIAGSVQGHVWSKVIDELGNTRGRAESWSLAQGVASRIVVTLRAPNPNLLDLRIHLVHPDGDTGELKLPYPGKEIPGGYQTEIKQVLPGPRPTREKSAVSKITVSPNSSSMDQRYQLTVEIQPLAGASASSASSSTSAQNAAGPQAVEGQWVRRSGSEVLETLNIRHDGSSWIVTGSEPKGNGFRRRIVGQGNGWIVLEPAAGGEKGARIRIGTDGMLDWESYSTSTRTISWTGRYTRTSGSAQITTAPSGSTQGTANTNINSGSLRNLALGRPARQSSMYTGTGVDQSAYHAVDGKTGGRDPHDLVLTNAENNPWWLVDLGGRAAVKRVRLFNRRNPDVKSSLQLVVQFSEDGSTWQTVYRHNGNVWNVLDLPFEKSARYVRISLANHDSLQLYEVEVWGKMK